MTTPTPLALADALSARVQTYPQQSEDEPGGYCTEADMLMDDAAALLRTQHAEIEASNRNLEQLTDELAQCRKEIESQTIVLDGMLARSVAIFERKDALLRQALDLMHEAQTYAESPAWSPSMTKDLTILRLAITKELSQ